MTFDLSRTFRVGLRVVSLRVSALRNAQRGPQFEIQWQPDQPSRLRGLDIAQYDAGYKTAKGQLLAEFARLQARST